MKKILATVLAALALAACIPIETCMAERRAFEGIAQGTVRSVLAAPEPEEPWERSHLSYEDPADGEPREQVVVRLDDGSEVTLLYAGPREIEPGERVRVYLGDRAAFLL